MAYKRPTVAQVRRLERQLREMRSYFWLEGFAAGRRSEHSALDDRALAATLAVHRATRDAAQLRNRIYDLEDDVFVHAHDGTRPLGLATLSNGRRHAP